LRRREIQRESLRGGGVPSLSKKFPFPLLRGRVHPEGDRGDRVTIRNQNYDTDGRASVTLNFDAIRWLEGPPAV